MANVQTGKLRGVEPTIFTGNRKLAQVFKQQFDMYRYMNDNHEIMTIPYYRTMQALSLIKGPMVDDWVNDQVLILSNKVNRAANPIARADEVLWTEFNTDFDSAFSDTTKKQSAQGDIAKLKINDNRDLDAYTARFKQLARTAGFAETALATARIYAKGLPPKLLDAILHRDTHPETLEQWINDARTEAQKFANRQAWKSQVPHFQNFMQHTPRNGGHKKYVHPNDRTVPMDVDRDVVTYVRRAVTQEDKQRFQREGRCFHCDKQGHMARDCPAKKHQRSPSGYRQSPSSFGQPRFGTNPKKPAKQNFRKFNKPKGRFQYTPQIRTARIEEVEEPNDQQEEEEEDNVPSLAARTARLSEDQREQWVEEMTAMGINF